MFTGIVTDVGRLIEAEDRNDGRLLRVGTIYEPHSIALGASVMIDGICLTVTGKGRADGGNWFEAFAALETLAVTEVGEWRAGRRLNLERALAIGDELGGHIVSGHIDGMAEIIGKDVTSEQIRLRFSTGAELARFIAKKGSVALNGTSLTVNEVDGNCFEVHLIPYTVAQTSWGDYGVGDHVNIEVDQSARYAARLSETGGVLPLASSSNFRKASSMAKTPHLLIIEARFYEAIADELHQGAASALNEAGASHDTVTVPGVLEIPAALAIALKAGKKGRGPVYDGFVVLGCVIRGETTHYEIVSNESARALMNLAVDHALALGNGIQTVENEDQAWARVNRSDKNKGGAAARAALAMIALRAKAGL